MTNHWLPILRPMSFLLVSSFLMVVSETIASVSAKIAFAADSGVYSLFRSIITTVYRAFGRFGVILEKTG